MNRLIIVGIMGMVMLSSCSRQVGAIFGKRKDKLEIVNPEFDYLTSKAKFRFDNGKKSVAATAHFRIKKDSIIWISVTPALGIEAARVLIDRGNVYMLDKIKGHYYEYTFEELSEKLDFDLNFDVTQSVILGNLVSPYKRQKIEKTEKYFSYTEETGMYLFHNFIGTKSMKLEKVMVFDEKTRNTISVNYKDFVLVDGQIFPNEIKAVIKNETDSKPKTEIKITYNKLSIETKPLSFPYSVSSRYERK